MSKHIVGIIGVGRMGLGIACSLQRAGWRIGFTEHEGNQPTQDILQSGAFGVCDPAELAKRCDTLLLVVNGSKQVEEILCGANGALKTLQKDCVVIDCSTSIPGSTIEMAARIRDAGGEMLDAAMTRTPREAAQGRLNLIVGGDARTLESRRPVLESFAENITHAGPNGAGHSLKLLHNYVSLGFSALLCEAALASSAAGIDPVVFTDVLEKGAGGGTVLSRIAPYLLHGDSGALRFTLGNADKDMAYYCEMAKELGQPASIALAVAGIYAAQVGSGHADRLVPELADLLRTDRPEPS